MANKNLTLAKRAKNDEFYTQISDIEKELKHYRNHFKDAVVFCNCDVKHNNFRRKYRFRNNISSFVIFGNTLSSV